MKKYFSFANLLTFIRLLGTLCLLFLTPLSLAFYVVYSISGVSDALDGYIARKTKSSTEFGAKLDSVADLLFYIVMILKIFPVLLKILPIYTWYLVIAAVSVRILCYITAAIKYGKFASMHTYLNKVTNIMIFSVPFFLSFAFAPWYCFAVALVGLLSSVEEITIHIIRRKYSPAVKALWMIGKE